MFRRKRSVDPRQRFVDAAARFLAEVDGVERVEQVGDAGLIVHRSGGVEPVELYVANLWLEVQGRPIHEQDEVLVRTLREMAESGDESCGEVLTVSADDGNAVRRAVEWATTTFQEAPRPLSPVPYAVVDGAIVPWSPPEGHPARSAVALAQVHLALAEYTDQTTTLRELFERVGEDVFVAEPSGRVGRDGEAFTYAVWPEVVTDGLLPEVDRVAMVGADDDEFFLVRWADVAGLAAEWLASEDLSPPRWRVRGWPPPDVVARLGDRAVH